MTIQKNSQVMILKKDSPYNGYQGVVFDITDTGDEAWVDVVIIPGRRDTRPARYLISELLEVQQ